MKYLVLGAGLQSKAIVHYLSHCADTTEILITDKDKKAEELAQCFKDSRIKGIRLDLWENLLGKTTDLMRLYNVVISAVPYNLNPVLSQAAITAKTHFIDLGGNHIVETAQRELSDQAKANDIAIAPAQGIAPGAVSILVAHLMTLLKIKTDQSAKIHIYVGGIPDKPIPPIGYALFFSVHGLINEYLEPAEIIRYRQREIVKSLTELEQIDFPKPFGTLEAVITSGGSSTLTRTLEGKVSELTYKTLRWPEHWEIIRSLKDLGFLDETPIKELSRITPRQASEAILGRHLPKHTEDALILRIVIDAKKENAHQQGNAFAQADMIVRYDPKTKLSAMQQTTGFSAAIVARMLANGTITKRGTLTTELDIPSKPFLTEWSRCGLTVAINLQKKYVLK